MDTRFRHIRRPHHSRHPLNHDRPGGYTLDAAVPPQASELTGSKPDPINSTQASIGRLMWDNVVAESFWSSLKRELLNRHRFATRAEARLAIFAWINRYNHRRLHSSLGYLPPVEWENQYRQLQAYQAAQPT